MEHDRVPLLASVSVPVHRFGDVVDERTAFTPDRNLIKPALLEAEALFADAVGARQAVFATCDSGISIHTAMLTVTGPERKILIDRNVPQPVVASLIRAGADPVRLRQRWDQEHEIVHPAAAADVAAALADDPAISSVLISTPTVYGTGADVRGVAEICHRHGVPLLVDEASAAHFPFHPDLPTPAIQAGADVAVQSLHEAVSIILVSGDLVDPAALRQRLELITTSSLALLFGPVDGFRRRMVFEGRRLLDDALHRVAAVRERLAATPAFAVMDSSIKGRDSVAEWDPFKLCVDVSALGITGYQAQEQVKIATQFGDARRIVCALTYDDDASQLADELEQLARQCYRARYPEAANTSSAMVR